MDEFLDIYDFSGEDYLSIDLEDPDPEEVGEEEEPPSLDYEALYDAFSDALEAVPSMDYDTLYDAVYDGTLDAIATYSQTVTDGQAVNNTALTYFQGILNNQVLPVDYVIYVGNSYVYGSGSSARVYYEYCMAYGDLELSGTHFSGNATVVTMRVNGYQSVTYSYGQEISLYAPMYYSRSNLGDYSGAVAYDWMSFLILIILLTGGLVCLFKKLMRLKW